MNAHMVAIDGNVVVTFDNSYSWLKLNPQEAQRFIDVMQGALDTIPAPAVPPPVPVLGKSWAAMCRKCGRVDYLDKPVEGVYFCGYGCS